MPVIQPVFKTLLLEYIDQLGAKGKIKINGVYKEYPIHKTKIEGDSIRKYIYLETEPGIVEDAQLLTSSNAVLAIKPLSIENGDDGLVIAFEFKITIGEVKE